MSHKEIAILSERKDVAVSAISINDFEIMEKIGRGRFGHIFRVKKKDNSKTYAMKVLFKEEMIQNGVLNQLMKEVEVQSKLKHKYILKLKMVTQDLKRVYLFMDIAQNGNIYAFLKRLGKFPEAIAGKYLRQLLNALIYLHQSHIVHRDIKPENLLLSAKGDLLLCDFGWCTEFDHTGRHTVCGTPDYLPPEMIQNKTYSEAVDSWTCGILCFEFLTGYPPFCGMDQHEKYSNILSGVYTCPAFISEGSKSFISSALQIDPTKRYSAGELFLHPWTQSQDESCQSLMEYENSLLKQVQPNSNADDTGTDTSSGSVPNDLLDNHMFASCSTAFPRVKKESRVVNAKKPAVVKENNENNLKKNNNVRSR